jgi:hypothetical protein
MVHIFYPRKEATPGKPIKKIIMVLFFVFPVLLNRSTETEIVDENWRK